ncbi:MAG: hypothetical protein ILO36_06700, partial [Abditibacteriota bacterium]|nr:hypothetical protein [Abditibacteriota bacterium]
NVKNFAGFSFDVFVKSLDPESSVAFFVSEKDGDRWVAVRRAADTPAGRWLHCEYTLENLSFLSQGADTKDPAEVVSFHIEPSGRGCEIYVAGPILRQKDGKTIDLLSPDSLLLAYAGDVPKHPVNPYPFKNRAFIAADMRSWGDGSDLSFIKALAKLFPNASFSSHDQATEQLASLNDGLRRLKLPLMMETQDAHPFATELSLKEAWGVRFDGASNNLTPGAYDTGHTACLNHPAYLDMQKRRVKAAADCGIKAVTWIDYITPYFGGRWGYADADIAAYRKALSGTDGGLDIIEDGKIKNVSFRDYYEDYTGFMPSPGDAGFGSWDEYVPPAEPDRVFEMGDAQRLRHSLFLTLCHYSWLKLLNETGNYYSSLNGGKLWIIPNPEDVYDGADYIWACRLAGVGGILCEYFGNPGFLDAAYHSGPYLRSNSDRGGALEGPVFETNAGGHGLPYYDPWVAFVTAFDLYAAMQANVTKNDFLEGDAIEPMLDPANSYAYARFADIAVKQYAFEDYLDNKPVRPETKTAVIGGRNVNRLRSSLFHSLYPLEGNPAESLGSLGFGFDLTDESRFAPWDRYDILFLGVWDINKKAAERLVKWVKDGNTLVINGTQPFARADGKHFSIWQTTERNRIDGLALGRDFGIEPFVVKASENGAVTKSAEMFKDAFPKGTLLPDIPGGLLAVKGETLLEADGTPVVTKRILGKGCVYYLGWNVGKDPAFDRAVLEPLANALGVRRLSQNRNASCHVYKTESGFAAALWNRERLENYEFVYDANRSQQLTIDCPGACSARIFVPEGEYLVYYVHADKTEKARGKSLLLQTSDTCELCYILPDTRESESLIEAIRRSPLRAVAEGRSKITLPG